jgi:hypothetical protein
MVPGSDIAKEERMSRSAVNPLLVIGLAILWMLPSSEAQSGTHHPIIYVMPNALANAGSGDNPQVVVDSSHNGKEPQVAKIYQELQRRPECKGFAENMLKEKADYFLLLQHGGGKGNRWAVSDKNGDVIASGESLMLGNSVKDACMAIAKDWQHQSVAKEN